MADSNLTKMREFRKSITDTKFRANAGAPEVVDIISDYAWTADKIGKGTSPSIMVGDNSSSSGGTSSSNAVNSLIPFCYVIERRSAVNAALANVFNMLNAADDIVSSGTEAISSVNQTLGNCLASSYDNAKEFIGKLMGKSNWIANFQNLLKNNNLNTDLLSPYRYMYITAPTNKKYVFPLYTIGNTFAPIKNAWTTAAAELPAMAGGQFLSGAQDLLTGIGAGFNFFRNVINLGKDGGSDIGTVVDEKPKQYTYPTDGDTIKVSFTLYNTTKQDAWKENYRFLYLFTFRNLPFRLDTLAYEPPFLYDVIVPGVSRYPVCSISALNITPQGTTRMMRMPNFLPQGGDSMMVAVPEAWTVAIDFSSLLGQTGNLMLSAMSGAINVTTSTEEEGTNEAPTAPAETGPTPTQSK